jgi:hypothetical protein
MAKSGKPNILVIWGDDIGISNLSCYSHGLMGYLTPNIDRIAKEGMLFTDSYGEQSCTAGRSSFITDEFVAAASDFIQRQHKAGKPFFVWLTTTTCTGSPTRSRKASARPAAGSRHTTTP